jgi:hypothetical protein
MNITPALTRKVVPPRKSYSIPPIINPMILARLPKLPATPCTAPCRTVPARFDSMDIKDGHIRPLPTANKIAAPYSKLVLLDTNKIKLVPKIMLPIMTSYSSENIFKALCKTGPWTKTMMPLNTA